MLAYDDLYPEYDFASHKGYGTAYHAKMIHRFGLSPIHRKSFKIPRLEIRKLKSYKVLYTFHIEKT
jgi:ribonuclease HII